MVAEAAKEVLASPIPDDPPAPTFRIGRIVLHGIDPLLAETHPKLKRKRAPL